VENGEDSEPATALQEIDRVLAAITRYKRPGYIEPPRDMVSAQVARVAKAVAHDEQSEPAALEEALQEAIAKINAAHQPVILAGEEIHRFGLEQQAIQLASALSTW